MRPLAPTFHPQYRYGYPYHKERVKGSLLLQQTLVLLQIPPQTACRRMLIAITEDTAALLSQPHRWPVAGGARAQRRQDIPIAACFSVTLLLRPPLWPRFAVPLNLPRAAFAIAFAPRVNTAGEAL